ncbi:glycoside hydrolase family 18 protein [Daedalea quercina L-15889]|uniref:Glycoside hydrolase family 18 protein n=1 Tax=Daedalea quercina L-15889 TaxID=1314783 RepID=A0A165S8S0_9APHY|nr:glycoside hydrolase family 18 protein [Daedalea quercina L-15889]
MLSFLSLGLLAAPAVHATGFPFVARDASTDSSNSTNTTTVDMVSAAWYTGWHNESLPLNNVSWDKYTHLIYSFAATTPTANVSLDGSNPDLLPQFVSMARENDVKAMVSVGGWGGSIHFSDNMATQDNITNFVQAISDFAQQYDLDGLDFDWEYPGKQGIGCNVVSSNDTDNFLTFLQAVRQEVGPDFLLTASVSLSPFAGSNGTAVGNVSDFASVLDWVNVMNYDVHGSWDSVVGPNAPLNDSCVANSTQAAGSAVSALAAWTAAGMPAHQIVLGVAGYGHSYSVNPVAALAADGVLQAFVPFDASAQPLGDAWDSENSTDVCGNTSGPSGVFDFWGLIEGGFLNANGSVANGINYIFDGCSQTPFVYDECSEVMVAYDDATSFEVKGNFVANSNMRGFAMWEAASDYDDILIDAIRSGAGFVDESDDC